MIKCRYADQYKAIHPPRCNGGDPCDVCAEKWTMRAAGSYAVPRNSVERAQLRADRMREVKAIKKARSQRARAGVSIPTEVHDDDN